MTHATRHSFFLVIITLLLHQNVTAQSAIQAPEATVATTGIRNADCIDFINERPQRVRCGFIDLPVNHDKPGNSTIRLPILIAGQTKSLTASSSGKAILVPGGGGPGASIGFGLAYGPDEYLGMYNGLRAEGFDVVILDQRGAGYANPVLRCVETATAFEQSIAKNLSLTESLTSYRESLGFCRSRLLSQDIQLQHFDTYQSARDYLAVISLLPYNWWGTLATSYATVIAQTMEILQPSVFDRIVLDSPVAIDYQQPYTFELTETAIKRILSLCEITRNCNTSYSNIKGKFEQILTRLKDKPQQLEIEIYDSENIKRLVSMPIDNITLPDILSVAAYSNFGIAEIPWIIDRLHKGNTNTLTQLATDYWHYNIDLDYSLALSWIIHCKERQPMERVFLDKNNSLYNEYSDNSKIAFKQEQLICADWSEGNTTTIPVNKTITTETLIVAGDLDPVISRKDIDNTADNFSNKKITILPGTGHSVWFQSACTRGKVAAFFAGDARLSARECSDGIRRFK